MSEYTTIYIDRNVGIGIINEYINSCTDKQLEEIIDLCLKDKLHNCIIYSNDITSTDFDVI